MLITKEASLVSFFKREMSGASFLTERSLQALKTHRNDKATFRLDLPFQKGMFLQAYYNGNITCSNANNNRQLRAASSEQDTNYVSVERTEANNDECLKPYPP